METNQNEHGPLVARDRARDPSTHRLRVSAYRPWLALLALHCEGDKGMLNKNRERYYANRAHERYIKAKGIALSAYARGSYSLARTARQHAIRAYRDYLMHAKVNTAC